LRRAAETLTSRGHPCLSIDYPASGLSPGDGDKNVGRSSRSIEPCATWLLQRTELTSLAAIGTCGGGRHALALSAAGIASTAICLSLPISKPTAQQESRLKELVGALGRKDGVTNLRKLRRLRAGAIPDEMGDLLTDAAEQARVLLMYGEHDKFHENLTSVLGSDKMPHAALQNVRLEVLPGAWLYPESRPQDRDRVVSQIDDWIAAGADG
jgi:dienelactone hydrolase